MLQTYKFSNNYRLLVFHLNLNETKLKIQFFSPTSLISSAH